MKAVRQIQRKRAILVAMLMLLALVTVLFAGTAAAQGPVLRIKGDIEAVLGPPPDHPCTGEPMDAHGEVVLLLHETGAGSALHISGAGSTMTGVDSGTAYRFNGALNEFLSADDEGYHSVHHFSWFSPTNDDAFIATFVSHTTVDGNGNVTVSFDFLNGGCK
jgi:hypothetical protein